MRIELSSTQRKFLRGRAHSLKPLVQVGKNGLSEGFYANLDEALNDHELIKLKFVDFKDQKREACAEIVERMGCVLAGTIGHVAVLYRPAEDPEQRKIILP